MFILDRGKRFVIPRTEMNLTRIMSYDDAFVLAKAQEEVLLYRDMDSDVVQQILGLEAAADHQTQGNGRVQMTAGYVADSVGHRENGQAESERKASKTYPRSRKGSGKYGTAATP